jgi:hypothetical protein
VLKLDYDAPHLRRNSRDWEWLKGGKVVLKVLPSEVKQVRLPVHPRVHTHTYPRTHACMHTRMAHAHAYAHA